MFCLLSSIWEMCKNTWPSLGTQLLLRQTDLDSDFAQTIWAKICWVGALLCTFIIFQSVHQRPAKCPPVSDQVSISERPSVHQRAYSFAQFAKLQNQGCFITVEKDLIDLCHVMTSFYRPRPASELPKLQHLSTTESARISNEVQVPKKNLNCPKCGLTQLERDSAPY